MSLLKLSGAGQVPPLTARPGLQGILEAGIFSAIGVQFDMAPHKQYSLTVSYGVRIVLGRECIPCPGTPELVFGVAFGSVAAMSLLFYDVRGSARCPLYWR